MKAFEKLPGFTRVALAVSIVLSACRDNPERTAARLSAPPVKVRVVAIEARTPRQLKTFRESFVPDIGLKSKPGSTDALIDCYLRKGKW
jgi:hypothetical protein